MERLDHDKEWLHKEHLEGPSSSPHMDQATVWKSLVIDGNILETRVVWPVIAHGTWLGI